MGFEEDYRQGLSNKHWGRAIKRFATGGKAEDVARMIKRGLSSLIREKAKHSEHSELASVVTVCETFSDTCKQATSYNLTSLFDAPVCSQTAVDDFINACETTRKQEENSNLIERLVTLGIEQLQSVDEYSSNTVLGTDKATKHLLVEFFKDTIATNLQPAMGIAGEKCNETPQQVTARLAQAIAKVPLDRLADQVLNGKGVKLRVQMPRATMQDFANQSILGAFKP